MCALGAALAAQGGCGRAADPPGLSTVTLPWNYKTMDVPGVKALARGIRAAGSWLKAVDMTIWQTADSARASDAPCARILQGAARVWLRRWEPDGDRQRQQGQQTAPAANQPSCSPPPTRKKPLTLVRLPFWWPEEDATTVAETDDGGAGVESDGGGG